MAASEPKLRELFSKAAECQTIEEQAAYLDQVCQGDAELRARLDELLQAQREAGSFLQEPSAAGLPSPLGGEGTGLRGGPTIDLPAPAERPGTIIGPYKLLQQIGEGGMGTVWMAQQTEPVKRLVALKLIKAGMDSKQVIARFEAERQALALMDHANIARVLDAGTTSAGRPYFVMDLVKGVPITKYCDEHHLTPRQRLELFIPVCQAVQHAHQKGIIHRDLKPSNVLVALYDGKPVPKVIDFGVAKAAGQSLTDKTLVTGFGAIVGTLEYMSPEQAKINQLDIDTRSDIYSLGVLLYELLTGSPPFTRKELEKAGMLEMLRVIREQEPSKPSTKLSTADGLPTLAANRGTEPAKLTKLVRGDLDWIVMKALEKDRNRRYETANGFAMDVQRYLADEPVLACPPSAGYRLRKFVRRNRPAVLVTLAAAVALLLAVAGLATSNALITRERNEKAAALEAYKEQLQRTEDALHLALSDESNIVSWLPFVMNEFDEVHPFLLPDEDKEFRLRLRTYQGYVRPKPDLRTAGLGTAEAHARTAWVQLALGQLRESEATLRLAIDLLERLAQEQPTVPECRTELSDSYLYLGEVLEKTSRPVEAELAYRKSLRLSEQLFTQREQPRLPYAHFSHKQYICHQLVWGQIALGRVLYKTGRLDAAEVAYRQALVWLDKEVPIYQAYGESCLRIIATGGLAQVLNASRRPKEAGEAYRRVCATWEKILAGVPGERHSQRNLAVAFARLGDFLQETHREKEAGEAYRRALKACEDLVAAHPSVPAYPRQLAWFLATGPVPELRDAARAVTLARKAADLAPQDGQNWTAIAAAQYRSGKWSEAQAALEKATSLRPWGDGRDWFLLAMTRWRLGDKDGARTWYDKGVEWTAKNDVHNDDLLRLKAEAVKLLEVRKK